MKLHDTEDDWTYHCSDTELMKNSEYFIKRNSFFNNQFKKFGIKTYDVSNNREEILNNIIEEYRKVQSR